MTRPDRGGRRPPDALRRPTAGRRSASPANEAAAPATSDAEATNGRASQAPPGAAVSQPFRQASGPPAPGLYLLAGPLGHLGDLTLRVIDLLTRADLVAAEDTRRALKLLSHLGLKKRLISYREQNHDRAWPVIRAVLAAGGLVALVSDAGAPAVADPGAALAAAARTAGFAVRPAPGPSAVVAALTASGFAARGFTFGGFLPVRSAQRRARLKELQDQEILIFFESPRRLAESLADLAAVLGPRPALMAREMTKLHEEYLALPLDALAAEVAARPRRGEITLVVGPPASGASDDLGRSAPADEADGRGAELEKLVERILAAGQPTRVAAAELAASTGWPKKAAYDLLVARRRRDAD
ncbi:MAG: 16S rRNA (cytidine(1402)-2'-O)-methyltransferase [Deltaproteobacteria bacterium]|jgi:16S rRNA (cytidine1402-2'-O)-methyltransferase|nr:16S rRNA (cytidine(1402)-2'-O)-methyltransferase [Deltaproteobacteria bacterium]